MRAGDSEFGHQPSNLWRFRSPAGGASRSPSLGRNAAGSLVRGSRSQAAPAGIRLPAPSLGNQTREARASPFAYSREHREACNFLFKITGQGLGPVLPNPAELMSSLNSLLREGDWPILLTFSEEKVIPGVAYSTGGEKADCEPRRVCGGQLWMEGIGARGVGQVISGIQLFKKKIIYN